MRIDLSELLARVREMGAPLVEFDTAFAPTDDVQLDIELEKGVQVVLADVDSKQGLLTYRGRQVLLYIPDQGRSITDVLDDGTRGRKFHVSECSTLQQKRGDGSFERYVATDRLSGDFDVYGNDYNTKQQVDGNVRLNVCQNCLKFLNYKGAAVGDSRDRRELVSTFSIDGFFATYSSVFDTVPRQFKRGETSGYTADWKDVSRRIRETALWVCGTCNVDLSAHRNLLHAHHRNCNKQDNGEANLVAVCADCHKKEPWHQSMFVSQANTRQINRVRREQGLLSDVNDWQAAFRMSDTAVHGVLSMCRDGGRNVAGKVPQVGYELPGHEGVVVAEVELCWPAERTAVVIGDKPEIHGWRILNIPEALIFFE
jgi:hypothetical protein